MSPNKMLMYVCVRKLYVDEGMCACVCVSATVRSRIRANQWKYICKWWYKLRLFLYRLLRLAEFFRKNQSQLKQLCLREKKSDLFFKANYIDRIGWSFWLNMGKSHLSPFDGQLFKETTRREREKTTLIDISKNANRIDLTGQWPHE